MVRLHRQSRKQYDVVNKSTKKPPMGGFFILVNLISQGLSSSLVPV
jgi:hypothetical protein